MKEDSIRNKERILSIYTRLMGGAVINKREEADRFNVAERSIQRDFDAIRNYLAEMQVNGAATNTIIYDRSKNGYRLEQIYSLKLTNPETLAICKILLDSRTLTKPEMDSILKRLIDNCVPDADRRYIGDLVRNEQFHYIPPKHGKVFLQTLWDIGCAIEQCRVVEFEYRGVRAVKPHPRRVQPVAIMNADMYFYMAGFITNIDKAERFNNPDDLNPTIYRIDRLENLKITDERFKIPYKDRFEEGEFRKRVQFMFGGPLRHVRFKYKGYSMEAVEDKLPTARVVGTVKEEVRGREQEVYIVEAEVYGDGIEQWFRQQGEMVEVISD